MPPVKRRCSEIAMDPQDLDADGKPTEKWKNAVKASWTTLDKKIKLSKVIFDKVIEGRFRDGDGYEEVSVLFVSWEADDMLVRKEVHRLEEIFRDRFRFNTETFLIPSERSATALARKISDWTHWHDSPNKMGIIYYGGHGGVEEESLKWMARSTDHWRLGQPHAMFKNAVNALEVADTDILLIIDCCYASRAFAEKDIGRRKFELLAAVSPGVETAAANKDASFTGVLCDKLEKLLVDHPGGFSTSTLYREVYFAQHVDRKPFLFDQAKHDYGRIFLRPRKKSEGPTASTTNDVGPKDDSAATNGEDQTTEGEAKADEESSKEGHSKKGATIDLRLHLPKLPTRLEINQLAMHMQYLPHINNVEFREMHAPDEELKQYMKGVWQIVVMKPLIKRLCQRFIAKRKMSQGVSSPSIRQPTPEVSGLSDWSGSMPVTEDGKIVDMKGDLHEAKRKTVVTGVYKADNHSRSMDERQPEEPSSTPIDQRATTPSIDLHDPEDNPTPMETAP